MTETITEAEYREQVEFIVEQLIEEAESQGMHPHDYVPEFVHEELDYHEWFDQARVQSGPRYGSIIEHHDAPVSMYSDWQSMIRSDDPRETLRKLAYVCMEADVLEGAEKQID